MSSETDKCIDTPDWEHLPPDVLSDILSKVFVGEASAGETHSLSVEEFWRTYSTIALVNKHWMEVLEVVNPPVDIKLSGPLPGTVNLDWLAARKLRSTAITKSTTEASDEINSKLDSLQVIHNSTYITLFNLLVTLGKISESAPTEWANILASGSIIAAHASSLLGNRNPATRIPALDSLQTLTLHHPDLWTANASFDIAVLSSLPALHTCILRGYRTYGTAALPPALAYLELEYGEKFIEASLLSHGISIVELPENGRLHVLKLRKDGVLGFEIQNLWGKVDCLDISAEFVLVGAPVADEELVADFRRPYIEGHYVPPHLLSDWDAIENSNNAADRGVAHFLAGLANRSNTLAQLNFRGPCARGIKIVPGADGAKGYVAWIHSVVYQAPHYLYGMSGAELLDRLLDMRARGALPSAPEDIGQQPAEEADDENEFKRWLGIELDSGAGSEFLIRIT